MVIIQGLKAGSSLHPSSQALSSAPTDEGPSFPTRPEEQTQQLIPLRPGASYADCLTYSVFSLSPSAPFLHAQYICT